MYKLQESTSLAKPCLHHLATIRCHGNEVPPPELVLRDCQQGADVLKYTTKSPHSPEKQLVVRDKFERGSDLPLLVVGDFALRRAMQSLMIGMASMRASHWLPFMGQPFLPGACSPCLSYHFLQTTQKTAIIPFEPPETRLPQPSEAHTHSSNPTTGVSGFTSMLVRVRARCLVLNSHVREAFAASHLL